MKISFENKTLRSICENEDEAELYFELDIVQKLKSRLSDLLAANSVDEIYIGLPGEIEYDGKVCYKIDLINNQRLIFSSNHPRKSDIENTSINWSSVSSIKILAIE